MVKKLHLLSLIVSNILLVEKNNPSFFQVCESKTFNNAWYT